MGVSIVICAFSEERVPDLTAAVDSLREQTVPPQEIIVVIDHNLRLLEWAVRSLNGARSIPNAHGPGLSGARNTGLAAARGEVVAFLDDDAIAAPDWIEQISASYGSPDVMGVGGVVAPLWPTHRPDWFPEEFDWVVGCTYRGMPQRTTAVRNLIGANMSFRRELFEQVGLFREGLGRSGKVPLGCEETELCIRAHKRWSSKKIIYNPAVRVSHRVSPSRARPRYFFSRCFAEGLSKALVSRLVGAESALASERGYALRILPRSVLHNIFGVLAHRAEADLRKVGFIVLGLALTALGYLTGRIRQWLRSSPPEAANSTVVKLSAAPAPQPLKVLMVTPRFFPQMGGVENHVYQTARLLAQHGVDISILTTDTSNRLPAKDEVDGLKVTRVRAWPRRRDYHFAPGIYRAIRSGSWDLVHVQSYHTFAAPMAMLAAWRAGVPYVVTFHGGGHSSKLRNALRVVQRALLRPLLARAAALVAVADFEIDLYSKALRLPRAKFVLIPNGCDLPSGNSGSARLSRQNGKLLASVGRLEKYKGHQRIIAALPYILERQPDVHLWIAGVGPYEAALRRLAEKHGVKDRVLIHAIPPSDRDTMAAELAAVDLLVLLSEYETHPIAVLEALSLGCTALVADSSGLAELAQRGLARAIPLNSSSRQIAEAVLDLLRQPLKPGALDLPTWRDCADGISRLYSSIQAAVGSGVA